MDTELFARETRPDHEGLRRLVYPCEPDTFLSAYLGNDFLCVRGTHERWSNLFTWSDLNAILNSDLISFPHARLVKDGGRIDPIHYTRDLKGRRSLSARSCQEHMSLGATLIVDTVEKSAPYLYAFTRQIERDLKAEVHVDAVATCAVVPGLGLHWDDAECFNIQLDGEKHWEIYRPVRSYPLTSTRKFAARSDVTPNPEPASSPTWTGILTPGDLLYLPRGWWHRVTPKASPSLHLSISIDIPTLADVLSWFVRQAPRLESFRQPLPIWLQPPQRRVHFADMINTMLATLDVENIEAFLASDEGGAQSRASLWLPSKESQLEAALKSTTALRLRSARSLAWLSHGGKVRFTVDEHSYEFSGNMLPIFERLQTMRSFTFDDLHTGLDVLEATAVIVILLETDAVVCDANLASS